MVKEVHAPSVLLLDQFSHGTPPFCATLIPPSRRPLNALLPHGDGRPYERHHSDRRERGQSKTAVVRGSSLRTVTLLDRYCTLTNEGIGLTGLRSRRGESNSPSTTSSGLDRWSAARDDRRREAHTPLRSGAGVHWLRKPLPALRRLWRSLKGILSACRGPRRQPVFNEHFPHR